VLAIVACVACVGVGCAGWTDGYAGPSYATAGTTRQDGYTAGAESLFSPKPHTALNIDNKLLPIGLHNALQVTLTPSDQIFSWLTGVAYFTRPAPVSGYAIAGTNIHVDRLGGRFSFGNFQPYGEVGVAARLGTRDDDVDGWVLTMGGQVMWLLNYLASGDEPLSIGYVTLKFGLGWDLR
jgi:hypothetical protein